MTLPAPALLTDVLLEIGELPVLRVRECHLTVHTAGIELAPSEESTDRRFVPTARWIELIAHVRAVNALQGLDLLDIPFACTLSIGSQQIVASEAHCTGFALHCAATGIEEVLMLRLERWTLEGAG